MPFYHFGNLNHSGKIMVTGIVLTKSPQLLHRSRSADNASSSSAAGSPNLQQMLSSNIIIQSLTNIIIQPSTNIIMQPIKFHKCHHPSHRQHFHQTAQKMTSKVNNIKLITQHSTNITNDPEPRHNHKAKNLIRILMRAQMVKYSFIHALSE